MGSIDIQPIFDDGDLVDYTTKELFKHSYGETHLNSINTDNIVLETVRSFLDADFGEEFSTEFKEAVKKIDLNYLKNHPSTLKRLIQDTVDKIIYHDKQIKVYFNLDPLTCKTYETENYYNYKKNPLKHKIMDNRCLIEKKFHILNTVLSNRYQSTDKRIMDKKEMNESLVRALSLGYLCKKIYEKERSMNAVASELKIGSRAVYRYLNLAYLSPRLVKKILDYDVPTSLTLEGLFRLATSHLNFREQEKEFYKLS